MSKATTYSAELTERAVRLVTEYAGEYPSRWAAIVSVAEKFACPSEMPRNRLRQEEHDEARPPGTP